MHGEVILEGPKESSEADPPFLSLLPASQVHDEVILEGPKESSDAAKALVVHHMANPWEALIQRAIQEGRRRDTVHAPRAVQKDDGSELPAPIEPLLVGAPCLPSHSSGCLCQTTSLHANLIMGCAGGSRHILQHRGNVV